MRRRNARRRNTARPARIRRRRARMASAPGHTPGSVWPKRKTWVQQQYGLKPLYYKLQRPGDI